MRESNFVHVDFFQNFERTLGFEERSRSIDMQNIGLHSLWGNDRNWGDQMRVRKRINLRWSRVERTSLGQVLGERLEQVYSDNSASAFEITVEIYLERKRYIVLVVFFRTMHSCKCLAALHNGFCNFKRPPSFS